MVLKKWPNRSQQETTVKCVFPSVSLQKKNNKIYLLQMSVMPLMAASDATFHPNDGNSHFAHPHVLVQETQIVMEMFVLINLLYYVTSLIDWNLLNVLLNVISHHYGNHHHHCHHRHRHHRELRLKRQIRKFCD